MITRIKSNKIICGDKITSGFIYFKDGIITEISDTDRPFDTEYNAENSFVSPGFIDMHTHGGGGYDFIKSTNDVINGCNFHLKHGTTSILPTLSAAPISEMEKGIKHIASAMKNQSVLSNIIGVHMEGPYLSAEQCGAQCTDFITPPSKDEYKTIVEKYKGIIARWTYAPENDTNGSFAKFMTQNSIIASAGHTNAIYDDMHNAIENGCKLITHLYSCTSTITRAKGFRRLGVIETAFLNDDLYVEIIADGKHVPAELVQLTLKIKGSDKIALVTDSLAPAGGYGTSGEKITHGFMNSTEFIIEDGVCKLADKSAFVGSIATCDNMVRFMTENVGIGLPETIKMLTVVPSKILKLNKGLLAPGKDADIIVFDKNIHISDCFVGGKKVL